MSLLDVLVVGAGPTGLVAAAELRRYGLSVRLVDKLSARSPLSRALGVQARSLEILDEMGCAEELISKGLPLGGVTLYSGTDPIASLNFDELITACWKPVMGAATGATTKSTVLKIAWQVVTNDKSTVPFDFCVSNVRALQ